MSQSRRAGDAKASPVFERKNALSDVFDPYSEDASAENLWPEDDPLPPAVEPSGFRPAPAGFNETPRSDVRELDARAAAVPTPRQVRWAVDEPDGESPLPVVTAASEPTQRGLGIPPPPSSREAPWFAQLPSLASAAAPSPESFTERGAQDAREAFARKPAPEQSENERITVRAPPTHSSAALTGRWRAIAVFLLSAIALVAGLVVRRATRGGSDPGSSVPAAVGGAPSPAAAALAVENSRPTSEASQPPSRALTSGESEALPDGDPKSKPRHRRSGKESRRQRTRARAHDADKARPSVIANVAAESASGSKIGPPAAEAKPPERREALSLPPR